MGVMHLPVLAPPVCNGVAAELTRVCAGVQVHVALVARQIVQAVRDQFALPCAGEIMVERLHLCLRVGVAFTGKVADQLLFLGVDADHGLAPGQIPGFESAYVFELCVAIGMRAHRLFLARFALAQAVLFEQLAHHVAARRRTHGGQAPTDLPPRQVGPEHPFSHRVARRELCQQRAKVLLQRGYAVNQLLASTAFFRTRLCAGSSGSSSSVSPRRTVLTSMPNSRHT